MHAVCRPVAMTLLAVAALAAWESAVAADGQAAAPPRARPVAGIEIQQCIDAIGRATPGQCPGFLLDAVSAAAQTCREVGGNPVGIAPASIWSLDVNADGKSEYLYEIGANVGCEGAWSVFSCGSLGCPLALVEERSGDWATIGGIYADAPGEVSVLVGLSPPGYYDLKVGCLDGDPCVEYRYYQWNGQHYETTYLDVRGFEVDVAGSVHGLRGLKGETAVLATPEPGAAVLHRYGADIEVAIIGQSGGYFYVSPCNACESGFVRKSSLRP